MHIVRGAWSSKCNGLARSRKRGGFPSQPNLPLPLRLWSLSPPGSKPLECFVQRHGRLLPPVGRMYALTGGEDSDEEAAGEHRGAGRAAGDYEGELLPPPAAAFEGALPPPPLPPPPRHGGSGYSALPFQYKAEQPGSGQGPYAAVGFSYDDQEDMQGFEPGAAAPQPPEPRQQRQQQSLQEDPPFSAPFLVPERLRAHLPTTQRQYKVRPNSLHVHLAKVLAVVCSPTGAMLAWVTFTGRMRTA